MGGGVDHSGTRGEDLPHSIDYVLQSPVVGVDDQIRVLPECRNGGVGLLVPAGIVHQDVQGLVPLPEQNPLQAFELTTLSSPDHLLHILDCFLVSHVHLDVLTVLRGVGEVLPHLLVQLRRNLLILGSQIYCSSWPQ